MNAAAMTVVLVLVLVTWLLVCMVVYRNCRTAAWLAGATTSACLFFLGATIVASFNLPQAFYLLPLWVGILVLLILHLVPARRRSSSNTELTQTPEPPVHSRTADAAAQHIAGRSTYI